MRRRIQRMAVLVMAVGMLISGCGKTAEQQEENAKKDKTSEAVSEAVQSDGTEIAEDMQPGENHILVAYFSWSGNTKTIAEMIAEETGGDLFEIVPKEPYSDDYDTVVDVAKEEQNEDARPEIDGTVDNWDSYDTVFIGYPNWWSDVPMIMNTFIESYDFTGKTVIPFCTNGGGGFGNSLSTIEEEAEGATILDGFAVSGSKAADAEEDVKVWLDTLSFPK